jgi:four helix bundle protein
MSNIAEGYGRYSRKDFSHFLHMARGSLLELKSLCILSADLGFLRAEQREKIEIDCDNVGRRLNALLRSLQQTVNSPVKVAAQSKANQAPSAKRQAQATKE